MSNIALQVEGLGKKYRIGERREAYKTLRDGVATAAEGSLKRLGDWFGRNSSAPASAPTDFWALRDVSFEVKHGEVVGFIGKNGAGKSTLLKILSRITEPTEGRAKVLGRIGSLLEVGTGFHPELTGRENVYLNGAILGMSKADIDRKFDEIVAFAEVEKFLETPVKRYSSGMQLRLGFAVAAHLEPEILIVDEVLAVGDAQFQQRCLSKIGEAARGGTTILLVSHNLASVEALCHSSILLRGGRLIRSGTTKAVIDSYLKADTIQTAASVNTSELPRRAHGRVAMQAVRILSGGKMTSEISMGGPLEIEVDFITDGFFFKPILGVVIKTIHGQPLFGVNNRFATDLSGPAWIDRGTVLCSLDSVPLMPGTYRIDLYLGTPNQDFDVIEDSISLNVVSADIFGNGRLPPPTAGPIFQRSTFVTREFPTHESGPASAGGCDPSETGQREVGCSRGTGTSAYQGPKC
jgi:lipopolysaccharide transport system ATP-binding protein